MVRSVGIAAAVLGLAWTGFVGAQASSPLEKARYIMVTEEGKPPQRCKLLKTWREADGAPAFQVQAVDTGELMTIVGTAPSGGGSPLREMSTRIFRWGRDNKPPLGAPVPPPHATVLSPSPDAPMPRGQTSTTVQKLSTVSPQPNRPAAVAATPRPSPTSQTVRKPEPSPVPAPPQPATSPYILTGTKAASPSVAAKSNALTDTKAAASSVAAKPSPVVSSKPSLTPMSTQVVQYSPGSKPSEQRPAAIATLPSTSQPRLTPLPAGSLVHQKPCNCTCSTPCAPCCKPCNPCGQSSCVCGTPSPMRQPLISRLFPSKASDACPTMACKPAASGAAASASIQEGKPRPLAAVAAQTTSRTPEATQTITEPAKPGDWRQSWGKVESWKGPVSASSLRPIEASKRADSTPVQRETALPPDPLKAPDQYRDMVMNARLANSKIPQENRSTAATHLKEKLAALKRPEGTRLPARPAEQVREPHTLPPNEGLPPSRVITIAADEPNAFWSPQQAGAGQAKAPTNAFDREPDPPPQGVPSASPGMISRGPTSAPPVVPGIMQGPPPQGIVLKNAPRPPMAPYVPPPGPPQPMPPDTGVPDAMANAFTLSGTRRPIPADFGGTPQEPNGFDPPIQMDGSPPRAYGMARPGAYRPPMPNAMAMMPQTPGMINPLMSVPSGVPMQRVATSATAAPAGVSAPPTGVPQLLAALNDSLRPSEREAAAEHLSELDWRIQPLVVEQLMKAAREDPAATVRAACVHALAQMKVTTPAALALVRDLKADRDPRVRQEAEEALSVLGDSGIQQASHK